MVTTRKFNTTSKAKIATPYEGTAQGADAAGTYMRDELIRTLAHDFGFRTTEGLAAHAPHAGNAGNIDNARVFGATIVSALTLITESEETGVLRLPLAPSPETGLTNCTGILTRIQGCLHDRQAVVTQLPYINDADLANGVKHALYYYGFEKQDLKRTVDRWERETRKTAASIFAKAEAGDAQAARAYTEIRYGLKALRMVSREYELTAQRKTAPGARA